MNSFIELFHKFGFTTLSINSEDPKIIVVGSEHTQDRFKKEEEMSQLINELANQNQVNLYFEGHNLTKEEVKEFIPTTSKFVKEQPNIIFNDNLNQLQKISLNYRFLSEAKYEDQIPYFNKKIAENDVEREKTMLKDPKLGILPNYHKKPDQIHIQSVGTNHAKFGLFETELKNIPHTILIPTAETTKNIVERKNNYFPQEPLDNWTRIIHELGYIGKNKKIYNNINAKFGLGNWLRGHIFDGKVLSYDDALKLYEKSYLRFFKTHPDELEWLTETASEVYDNSLTNIASGLDYSIQETDSAHLQDIAIRRCLKNLGQEFKGDHPIEVRGYKSEGYCLNPGQIKFMDPEKILDSCKESWWKKGSIEHFWQDNKILLVRPSKMILKPEYLSEEGLYLQFNKKDYYLMKCDEENTLYFRKGRDVRKAFNENRNKFKKIDQNFMTIEEVISRKFFGHTI